MGSKSPIYQFTNLPVSQSTNLSVSGSGGIFDAAPAPGSHLARALWAGTPRLLVSIIAFTIALCHKTFLLSNPVTSTFPLRGGVTMHRPAISPESPGSRQRASIGPCGPADDRPGRRRQLEHEIERHQANGDDDRKPGHAGQKVSHVSVIHYPLHLRISR